MLSSLDQRTQTRGSPDRSPRKLHHQLLDSTSTYSPVMDDAHGPRIGRASRDRLQLRYTSYRRGPSLHPLCQENAVSSMTFYLKKSTIDRYKNHHAQVVHACPICPAVVGKHRYPKVSAVHNRCPPVEDFARSP